MPVYTYRREDGTTFDYRQKFLDEPLTVDPETGQHVTRVIQPAGVIFKGSGFYINDSKSSSRSSMSSTPKSDKTDKPETTSKAESSESKPAASTAVTESSASAAPAKTTAAAD